MIDMYEYERKAQSKGYTRIAGLDEAGRGCLAGPLCAAAVILNEGCRVEGVNDSKKLSANERLRLYEEVKLKADKYMAVFISPLLIDKLNIYQASAYAMELLIKRLRPDYALVDALKLKDSACPYESIVKGDAKSASIAAASIIAKVERDMYMKSIAQLYDGYGFETNMGYPTAKHREAIKRIGITPLHRRSYAPVKEVLDEQYLF